MEDIKIKSVMKTLDGGSEVTETTFQNGEIEFENSSEPGPNAVIPNPEMTGSEPELDGLQIGNNKFNVTEVEANPTIQGSESDLLSIGIDGTNYKIPQESNKAFKSGWPTNSTTKAFCDAVNTDTSAIVGMTYLGEVTFSDMPTGLANAELLVEIMHGSSTHKTIHLVLSSGNLTPYRWEYTYWNDGTNVSGWIGFQPELKSTNVDEGTVEKVIGFDSNGAIKKTNMPSPGSSVIANPTLAGTEADLTALEVNGTKYAVPQGGGGGSALYIHNITLQWSGYDHQMGFVLISSSSEAFTTNTIKTFIADNGSNGFLNCKGFDSSKYTAWVEGSISYNSSTGKLTFNPIVPVTVSSNTYIGRNAEDSRKDERFVSQISNVFDNVYQII